MSAAMRCDQCGTFAETGSDADRFVMPGARRPLPVGWRRLFIMASNDPDLAADVEAELCGLECAAAYTAALVSRPQSYEAANMAIIDAERRRVEAALTPEDFRR